MVLIRRWFLAPALALSLAGCASAPPVLPVYFPSAAEPLILEKVPFYPQQRYQCGPAALAMTLGASGVDARPAALVPKVWIPELEGSLQAEMIAAARRYKRVPYVIEPRLSALLAELDAGHPVLVLLNLGWDFYPIWHYAVVIGYRPADDALILHSGTTSAKIVDTRDFLDNWHKADNWGVVLLQPGTLPAGSNAQRYLRAVAGLEQLYPVAAEVAYEAATRRWPGAAAAWFGLGNARYAQGEYAGAAKAWHSLLKRQPRSPAVRNNLAQLLAEQGCKSVAVKQIETALSHARQGLRSVLQQTRADIRALPDDGQSCRIPLRR